MIEDIDILTTKCRFLDWGEHRLVWIDDEHIEACVEQVRNGTADGLAVSPAMGYRLPDIAFLRSYPFVKGVILSAASSLDVSALECLENLEFLSVAENKQTINLGRFRVLREAWLDWHEGLRFSGQGSLIRVLALHHFRPESGDLTCLPNMPYLEDLSLISSSMVSLKGIGKQKGLRRCEISYALKLKSLEGLLPLADQLRTLECQQCPSLCDYQVLGQMELLEDLKINRCATIPSLRFVIGMKSLRQIRFMGTDVVDGDMAPLLVSTALKTVAFTTKKHFSHHLPEVQQALGKPREARRHFQ